MNKLFSNGAQLFRRLSVFYLFFLLLLIVFSFYQYRVKPGNESEINDRAKRVLSQVSENFIQKDKDVSSIFTDTSYSFDDLREKKQNLKKFSENIPYSVTRLGIKKFRDAEDSAARFRLSSDGKWELVYLMHDRYYDSLEITIDIEDFVRPLLEAREELFDNFFLLFDSTSAKGARRFPVIYSMYNDVSSSPDLDLDTLHSLQKNSDLSAVTDISIGGAKHRIFLFPFRYHQQHLVIAGLMPSDDYNKLVSQAPLGLLPTCINCILLILVFIPFLKLFFLSPRESINLVDLRAIIHSFYAGSAVLLVILFYLLATLLLKSKSDNELLSLNKKLVTEIEQEVNMADSLLYTLDTAYASMPAGLKQYIQNDTCLIKNTDSVAVLDKLMASKIRYFKELSRVFWVDSTGQTLGKWNAFNFIAPLTNVNGFDFFKKIHGIYPGPYHGETKSQPTLIYTGKSNSTNEFQVYFSKPSKARLYNPAGDTGTLRATAICLAGFISASEHSVLRPGLGYCMIDENGDVLMDSDPRRNLSENIIQESHEDNSLMSSMHGKNRDRLMDIRIYGEDMRASVAPVKGQSLFVLAYYEKKAIDDQVFQSLQVACTIAGGLFLTFFACALFVIFGRNGAVRLPFRVAGQQWIRPSSVNTAAYLFDIRFFSSLGGIFLAHIGCKFLFGLDDALLIYLSLLLPFYALLGFVYSRARVINEKSLREGIKSLAHPIIFIIFYNIVVSLLMAASEANYGSTLALLISFQVFAIGLLLRLRAINKYIKERKRRHNEVKAPVEVNNPDARPFREFTLSLSVSVLVISFLPVSCILLFAWSSENVQVKKNIMLKVAENSEAKAGFLNHEFAPGYRAPVLDNFGNGNFMDSIAYEQGNYLFGGEGLSKIDSGESWPNSDTARVGDELFFAIGDNIFSLPLSSKTSMLKNKAADESWMFRNNIHDRRLELYHRSPDQTGGNGTMVYSAMPVAAGFSGQGFLFVLTVLLALVGVVLLGYRLINNSVERLFLLDFALPGKIKVDGAFIAEKIADYSPSKTPLAALEIPDKLSIGFFEKEWPSDGFNEKIGCTQEEYIMAATQAFCDLFDAIWNELSQEEKYVLFDFCQDRLTNYKNTNVLFGLISKGVLIDKNGTLDVFSPSFRNYVLSKSGDEDLKELNEKFAVPGIWSSIKIPVFSAVAVTGLFILFTQSEVTHRLTGFLASITALWPLVVKLFEKKTGVDGG